ncbi:MAG: Gfo/Idh/MocA family oxidoreductase, partial [Pseudomonadota bacterium]
DMMIHDFDMAAFLFGMPARVMAHGACLVDDMIAAAGDIDTAVVTMEYDDGRLATIRNSRRAAYGYDQRVEVLGSTGLIAAENETENTLVRKSDAGSISAKPVYFFLERYRRAFANEWSAFVSAVIDGTSVPSTIQDGVNSLALAEAANISFTEHRPVDLVPEMTQA